VGLSIPGFVHPDVSAVDTFAEISVAAMSEINISVEVSWRVIEKATLCGFERRTWDKSRAKQGVMISDTSSALVREEHRAL
jgi:hypothetical protein